MARTEIVTPDHRPVAADVEVGRALAASLEAAHGALPTAELIRLAVDRLFAGRIAVVSSFGAESAVLLDLVAEVAPHVPVLFVDTGKLFGETLRYRDRLVERLGLTDVRVVEPDPAALAASDPQGVLWYSDTDACCAVRKVAPLAHAIEPFDAWISGRKRFQATSRADIPTFEADGRRIKINPLAAWSPAALAARVAERELPAHPLVADGYPSIGCMPCTSRVAEGEDARSGRWRGLDKTECGIHLGLPTETATGVGHDGER